MRPFVITVAHRSEDSPAGRLISRNSRIRLYSDHTNHSNSISSHTNPDRELQYTAGISNRITDRGMHRVVYQCSPMYRTVLLNFLDI